MIQEYVFEDKKIGSSFLVSLIADSKEQAWSTYKDLALIADEYEQRFSRFRPDSELSQLNEHGTVRASVQFREMITLAKTLYDETGGTFNPLVDIARFGYDKDIALVRGLEHEGPAVDPYAISFEGVEYDNGHITFTHGQRIDMGGFLKGHMAEVLALVAQKQGIAGGIVNVGGDSYTWGRDAQGERFQFEIEHPTTPETPLVFSCENSALATSGSYKRKWKRNNTEQFHILDASGLQNPNTDVESVTVLTQSGARADAFATTALILGSTKGSAFLTQRQCAYCFILKDGSVRSSPEFFTL